MQEPWQPHLPPGPCPRNVNKVVGGKFFSRPLPRSPLFLPEDLEASAPLHLCDLGKTQALGFHTSPTSSAPRALAGTVWPWLERAAVVLG